MEWCVSVTAAHKSGCQKQALNTQILHYTIKIVAMENKARYNILDDKIVIIVTLPDKVRDRPLRCLRFLILVIKFRFAGSL